MKLDLLTLRGTFALIVALTVSFLLFASSVMALDLRQGLEDLSAQLSKSIPEQRRITVAVTDFVDLQGQTSELGRYIAERLTTRLSQLPKFRVIERRRLSPILNELRFSMSDLVDPAKAKQFGKLLGVEALVLGTISDVGSTVDIDARVIEIETSNILPGATVNISKDPDVARLMERRPETTTVPTRQPAQRSPTGSTLPTAVRYQEFPKFRVEIEGLQVGPRGDLTVFLAYVNKTQEELDFALIDVWAKTFVIDNAGNRYRYRSSSGLSSQIGSFGIMDGSPLAIAPGTKATTSFTFEAPREMERKGSLFSFTSEQAIVKQMADTTGRRARTENQFNVSIRNIEPR